MSYQNIYSIIKHLLFFQTIKIELKDNYIDLTKENYNSIILLKYI